MPGSDWLRNYATLAVWTGQLDLADDPVVDGLLDLARTSPDEAATDHLATHARLTLRAPAPAPTAAGSSRTRLAAAAVTMAEPGLGRLRDVLGMIEDPQWVCQLHTWLRTKDARVAPDPGAVMRIAEQPAELRHRAQVLSSVAAAWAGDRPQDAAEILIRARCMTELAI
ncbi:hypothetical protein ACFT25_16195 [Streptomyces hydrogenans]|uniref:hypothetical protein n=1 Tax=Streptomyces hydrogenans TaxID=1873719 RepID=UPI00363354EA